MFSITGTSLVGITKNTSGLWTLVHAPTSQMTLDTTADTYAVGCEILNLADGIKFYNRGTVAAPSWESEIISISVPLTAAQINGMYAASVPVISGYAGKAIILDSFVFDLTGTATQFAGGGVVNLQYKNTANGAGTTLHADIAASVLTGATGRVITQRIPKDISATATADITGVGVWLGNKTGAFTTGKGTAICKVRYHLV
jgi:hypothetical protein